jgi:hypothetical protein
MAQNASPEQERKKQILAVVLGVLALLAVGYTLFGGSSSTPASNRKSSVVGGNSNSQAEVIRPIPDPGQLNDPTLQEGFQFYPIAFSPLQPAAGGSGRNIFAFPPPPPPPTPFVFKPTPTPPPPPPTPPPPLYLGSVSPGSVFAGTGDFTLTAAGDKFTPATRIYFEGAELPTRFVSPQQLIATVAASFIKVSVGRNIAVRSPDGLLYSNPVTLTINEPPKPDSYVYVGMIGTRFRNDTAILKNKTKAAQPGQDLETYQRGDVVGGRFKVMSISERDVELVDTALNLKYRLPMERAPGGNPTALQPGFPSRSLPPPTKGDDDDDPQ